MYCWRLASAAIASLFLVTVTMAQIAFPELTGRVVDGANLLSDTKEEEIVDMLRQHEDTGGDQVVVATVQSLQGRTIEEFAVELARYWGIGQEGRNNGVLLLVAPNERQVRIKVGYGLEGVLTDARAATIIANEIVPPFRAGDRAKGIVQGVQGILAALEKRPDTVSGVAPEKQKFALPPVIIFFIFIMIILSLRSFGRASRRHNMRGHRDWHTGGRMSGGSFSGGRSGGFSGGGGSFGGGGSSGSW
jgi:uncharacterized protein